MKKRVLLLSDSLALPRREPEETLSEDTYPFLLKTDFEVVQFSKGGGLISEFVEQTFYYKQYSPDYVILQCGIVDCAPRAFTRTEELYFQSNRLRRGLRRIISKTVTTKRLRNLRRKSWTPAKDFRQACLSLMANLDGIPVYALSILPASPEYELQVPGITAKIKEYNQILSEVFGNRLIDLNAIPLSDIMSDHHHLNKNGHLFVRNRILESLDV